MKVPLVSVIVPNYNHAPYLKQRLDSIFNQTFQDFEVIILDDCSTDNSKEIIEEYRNRPQISHIVYNETNSGSPFKQWAKGFELAQGEYIWIAESDDWAENNFLEEIVPLLDSNNSVALAFSASTIVYTNKKSFHTPYANDTIIDGKVFIKNKMLLGNSISNASAVVFRKSSLYKISNQYLNFKNAGDYLFWILICQTGSVAFKAESLNNFRQHSTNTTSQSQINGTAFFEVHTIFNYLKSNKLSSTFDQKLCSILKIEEIKEIQKKNKDEKKTLADALKLWKSEIKFTFINQSIYFSMILLSRIKPFSTIKKIHPCISMFDNYAVPGLTWKILHLPNTNLRKR